MQIIFSAVLSEGDRILAPGPHYPPYMAYPQMSGAITEEYMLDPDDSWRVRIDDIRNRMNDDVRMLVLINPNNPTGNVMTAEEIDQVISIVNEYPNCMIIADEIYDGLDFNDRGWMNEHRRIVAERREIALSRINSIDGLEVEPTGGAFYMFVRITHPRWKNDDKQFVLSLLQEEKVLLVHGSGFSKELGSGHIRLVHLADPDTLNEAFDRIERFLKNT